MFSEKVIECIWLALVCNLLINSTLSLVDFVMVKEEKNNPFYFDSEVKYIFNIK